MSKMGISTLRAYRHTQTFEAIGLEEKFVETFFPGTFSRIGGVGLSTFEKEYIQSIFEKTGKNKEKTAAFLGVKPILLETKI